MPGPEPPGHLISIIVPVHNGASWIERCFQSILNQTALGVLNLEVCVCNDRSTDQTPQLLQHWQNCFERFGITLKVYHNHSESQGGVGYSKNRAVELSAGDFLCFQDIDDVMLPERVEKQYHRALREPQNTLVGCQFRREPPDSTVRYTKWANNLSCEQLKLQIFTSHGPTVIMPTWFCHRKVYDRVGGFSEKQQGCPEDLIFFYQHLDLGGTVCRVEDVLLVYTFHPNQTTFTIKEESIWDIRLARLARVILSKWPKFTIWNAGKQGRRLYKSLSQSDKGKVVAFCDVDPQKIGTKYREFDETRRKFGREVDIVHFKEAVPPFVICVKMDLTGGQFEANLRSLNLTEGVEYVMFN